MIRTSRATRYTRQKKAECDRELLKNKEVGINQRVTIDEFGDKVPVHKHGGKTQ